MKGTQLFLATLFLLCVAFALTHVTASTSGVSYGESNDEIRANRLRNLADAIAELKAEADQEREEERMQTQRMLVQVSHETQATTQTQAATSTLSASFNAAAAKSQARDEDEKEEEKEEEKSKKKETSSDEDEDEDEKKKKAEKAAPVSKYPKKVGNKGKYGKKGKKPSKSQGTRRKDLVALYRFESEKNPGKGLGGPGRNLKVFGKGMKVVKGKKVAAHGRGALFVAARPTTVPAQVDATNPFQNSWLARDAKGTPIDGLPKGDESFTIAAWYKVTASKPGRYGVVSIGQLQPNQANIVRVSSNGQASASFKTGQVLTSNNTADLKQQWHHAAVTWNKESKTQKIYVDGKLAGSRQLDQAPAIPANGAFFVGLTANAPDSEQFTGFLDDVAIFRVALKSKDIRRIKKGRFDKYLDLFSLRSCTSRVGHRQHGAGFVMGSAEDQISLSETPEGKYGFNAKNAFECAKKCSQTTDCRQSVFYANAPAVGGAPAPAAATPAVAGQPAPAAAAAKPVQHSGSCYLMNKKYPTYEADKSATSTVCRKPKRYLRRRSTKLKGSPVYEKATAKRRADRKAKRDAKKKEREAKKAKAAKYGKANNNSNNNNNKYGNKAGKNKYAQNVNKNKYGKNASNKNKYSQPPGAGAANVPSDLKSKYEAKIRKLQAALAAKDQALKQLQSQSTHRVLLKTRKAEQVIAKLTRRLAKASRKLNSKEDDAATLALAAKIKLEADRKAEEILKVARKKSVHVKKEAKKIAVRRLKKKAAKRQAKVKKTLKRVSKLKKKAKKLAKKLAKNDAKKSEKLARAKEAKIAAKKAAKKQAMTAAQKALHAAKKKAAKKANKAAKKAAKKAGQAAKAKIAAALKRAKKADGSKVKPKVKVNKAANGGMF